MQKGCFLFLQRKVLNLDMCAYPLCRGDRRETQQEQYFLPLPAAELFLGDAADAGIWLPHPAGKVGWSTGNRCLWAGHVGLQCGVILHLDRCCTVGLAHSRLLSGDWRGKVDHTSDTHGTLSVSGTILSAGDSLWAGAFLLCKSDFRESPNRSSAVTDCALFVSDRI